MESALGAGACWRGAMFPVGQYRGCARGRSCPLRVHGRRHDPRRRRSQSAALDSDVPGGWRNGNHPGRRGCSLVVAGPSSSSADLATISAIPTRVRISPALTMETRGEMSWMIGGSTTGPAPWRDLVPDDACLVDLLGSAARRSWERSGAVRLTHRPITAVVARVTPAATMTSV